MGLLLLLTSTLLSSYFLVGRVVTAQHVFIIKHVNLTIEPSFAVTRDTSVTLRCQAVIISSGQKALSREYTIYKGSDIIYTKTTSSSEDLLYLLPQARVSNTGKYRCAINIGDKEMSSPVVKLGVTGLSKPVVHINKNVVSEGEELTVRCMAPGETGSILFYFYDDSNEIQEQKVNSNQTEAKLRFNNVGIHKIHCAYIVPLGPESFKSEESDTVTVSVKMLPITAYLEIAPQYKIYEGDQLFISCTVHNSQFLSQSIHLYLSQGNKLLGDGDTKVNHTLIAQAKDPGEFECNVKIGNVVKITTKTVSVTELFSVPTLTMSPPEVFQRDNMTLTCNSKSHASEKISKEDVIYSLHPPASLRSSRGNGVFSGRSLLYDFNYTCSAQAKGIIKYSNTLTVRPKVTVSIPRISVAGKAVLGEPAKILCQSNIGSMPINYTLWKDYIPLNTTTVHFSSQQALFTVTIHKADEIKKYMCEAKNGPKEGLLSKRLDDTVIEPLMNPTLTVIPNLSEISEGHHLYLICGTRGTPPITFKWYRVGNEVPLDIITTNNKNNSNYEVPFLSKAHSGRYYCEAINHANNVRSDVVEIEVRLALWKKAVIGGFCLLVVSAVVVVCVLCFRSKRGKREAAAELSVKPSSPKSDDSLTVNLTHDTEVYNTDTVRVDKAAVSVWSKKPAETDTANDEESSVASNEPDVEYTEVVHPRLVDPARVPVRKGTDTVYSELQNSPHGAADHHHYGSVEYAELSGEQPDNSHYYPEVNNYQDLPEPVD